MEFQLNSSALSTIQTLKNLVSELAEPLVPITIRNNSFIVNDVPIHITIAGNVAIISGVLDSLFRSIAIHASDSCIRVTAKEYGDAILIEVRDQNIHTSTLAYNLHRTQMIAEKIGGFLGVTHQWQNETVVVLSFPNLPVAA